MIRSRREAFSGAETDWVLALETSLLAHANRAGDRVTVTVVGHSDSTGLEATHRPLSQSRAERVLAQLVKQGVDARQTSAKGVASNEPLRTEDSEDARQYNRSVTFRVASAIGKAKP